MIWYGIMAMVAVLVTAVLVMLKRRAGKREFELDEDLKNILDGIDISDCGEIRVASHLENYVLLPRFKAQCKQEAIEKLIAAVASSFPNLVKDIDKARTAVFAREALMPTGLDHGIAVPHGRTDGVSEIVGAVALVDNTANENGIIPDYETIDHSRLQILFLTIAPDSTNTQYLQLMAYICRLLRNESMRRNLLSCKTADEMHSFLLNF